MFFQDHFSPLAESYAQYRPQYPAALFAYLATLTPEHELAWDCATGNGQAAQDLVPYYTQIVATDASAAQIAEAIPHPHITYQVAPAEQVSLADHTVDLIVVAQALHWFDFGQFYPEVRRVLKASGVLAVWTYGLLHTVPQVLDVLNRYYTEIIGPYWPPERRYVDEQYRSVPFPLLEIQPPAFQMEASWNLQQLIGYLRTWSATRKYRETRHSDPLELIMQDLQAAWGATEQRHPMTWPLYLRIGRK